MAEKDLDDYRRNQEKKKSDTNRQDGPSGTNS